MANYMTTDIELTAIADAIRAKASGGDRSGYKDYILGLENSVSVNDPDSIITVTYPAGAVCTCSDGTTTLTAPNTSGSVVFGVEIGTWTVAASKDEKSGTQTITIDERRQNKEIEIFILPSIGNALNNYSWADISVIAQTGMGDTYFDIGDCKAVILNGTVGTLSLNITLYVFILDFNHPINKAIADNNIIFGGFKTALTGGADVALCDSKYSNNSNSGKYFNMNHGSSTNVNGWKGCDLRYDILGATSSKNSDATQMTITSPVTSTLMAALPSDMRAVLRLWAHYVDNVGNSSNTDSNVTSVVDAGITLLAEYEIFGSKSYANNYEQNHQKQMAYYSSANMRKKYSHSATNTAVYWWESSARYNSTNGFCLMGTDGSANVGNAGNSYGLVPAFKI